MITPVLLAGDDGLSLRPVSQTTCPMRCAACEEEDSPFRQAAEMLRDAGCTEPIVVTAPSGRDAVLRQLHQLGLGDADILVTPHPLGTAPAVMAAALRLELSEGDLLFICSAPRIASDIGGLVQALAAAREAAASGTTVTFGLPPEERAFDHGCLQLEPAGKEVDRAVPAPLKAYVDPPGRAGIPTLIAGNDHLGHSQTYLVRVDRLIATIDTAMPDLYARCCASLKHSVPDSGATLLDAENYGAAVVASLDPVLLDLSTPIRVVTLARARNRSSAAANCQSRKHAATGAAAPMVPAESGDPLDWHLPPPDRPATKPATPSDWQRFLH